MSKMRQKTGKGSFRGVPFLIADEQGMDGGRRLVRYEYPLRDDGMTEDLGLRLRNYHISCLVIGDDHVKQAEKLIEALEKPGAGTLKHPYFGTKEVCVNDYKAVFSTNHLRVTRFDISFTPEINEIAPLVQKDTLLGVLNQYADALNALADEFADMIDSALDFIDELTAPLFSLIDAFIGLIDTVFDGIGAVLNSGNEFKSQVSSFKNRISHLIRTPKNLAKELQGLIQLGSLGFVSTPKNNTTTYYGDLAITNNTATTDAFKNAANARRAFVHITKLSQSAKQARDTLQAARREISKSALDTLRNGKLNQQSVNLTIARTHEFNLTQDKNAAQTLITKSQFVLLRLIRASLAVEYGKIIAQVVNDSTRKQSTIIESRADAQRYMNDVDCMLEQLVFDCADNEQWQSYEALEQFRMALLLDLRTRGEQLAISKMITLKDTLPALVVDFNATGSAKNWERFVYRNQVRHPLFCSGGTDVEVLA